MRNMGEGCRKCGKYRPECGLDYDDECPNLDEVEGLEEDEEEFPFLCKICYMITVVLGVLILLTVLLNALHLIPLPSHS